jgi:hypothetical protein
VKSFSTCWMKMKFLSFLNVVLDEKLVLVSIGILLYIIFLHHRPYAFFSKFPSCIVVAPCLCISKFPSNNLMTCLHKCLKLFPFQKNSRIMNLDNFVISMIKSRRFHLFMNHVLCFVHVLALNMHWSSILEKEFYMFINHKSQHHKLFGACLHGS